MLFWMATLGWFCRKSETRNKSFFLFRHHHGNATPRRNHIPSTFGATNRDTQIQRQNEREREKKRMYFWFVLWRPFERMMTETFQFPVYFFIVLSLFLFPSLSFLHVSHHVSLIILYFLFYFTHSVYFNINFKQYSTGKLSLLLFLNTFLCVSFKNYYFFFLSLNFKMSFKGN